MKEQIVIFGAGGCGREIIWQINSSSRLMKKYDIIGFVDDTASLQKRKIDEFEVVGDTEWLIQYKYRIGVIVGVGNPFSRKIIYEKLKENENIYFPTIVADDVIIANSSTIGMGSFICMGTKILIDISIGDFFYAGIGCCISHDNKISDFVTLYPNVNLSGNVTIEELVEIGTGVKIIPKVKIGQKVVIGAGAVVISDIPKDVLAIGVPAIIKKNTNFK